MDVHVPEPCTGIRAIQDLKRFITDGLDAVILDTVASTVYPGSLKFTLTGNQRDLAIAVERAARVGGVVD